MNRCLAPIACLAIAAGCTTTKDTAVFVTKTSLGIEVDSKPPAFNLGYDRVEGFYGPRFASGGLPQVAGAIRTDNGFLNRKVHQVYATGTAATIVVTPGKSDVQWDKKLSGEKEPMFFGTATSLGIRLGWSAEPVAITDALFGYKRKEISIIPLAQHASEANAVKTFEYPPVIASLDNGLTASEKIGDTKVHVAQYFATGDAAVALAKTSVMKGIFEDLAKSSLAQFRDQERLQQSSALTILYCLSEVPDDKLQSVRNDGVPRGLFKSARAVDDLKGAPPARFRSIYAAELLVTDPSSSDFTRKLVEHEKEVCKLAGK
jgi:hypothetical protein